MARLGNVCDVRDGTHDSPSYVEEGYPLVTSKNIIDGKLDLSVVSYVSFEDYSKINERSKVDSGDIIMPMIGTIGNPYIVEEYTDFAIKNVALIKFTNEQIFNKYIFYFLNSEKFKRYIYENNRGGTQKFLSLKDIRNIEIEIPTLDKQVEIVAKLDKVSELICLREQQFLKLDELVKARFVEMFGDPITNPMEWKLYRFDSLCENLDSRRRPITASEREAGIYPYYGASGIVDYVADYIFDENILLVSEDGANLIMRSTPIAFSVSGKVWVNNHAHVVRFEKMSMQKYIEVFFSLIDISDHITGSAQPKLNQAKLNAMMFPVPSDERLESFLQFIEQVDKSKVAVQKALDEAQTLFDSLMQEYFG